MGYAFHFHAVPVGLFHHEKGTAEMTGPLNFPSDLG
jgi:hypothetical protein